MSKQIKVGDIFYLPQEIIRERDFDRKYSPYRHPLNDYVKIQINYIHREGKNGYATILYNKIPGISFTEDLSIWVNENDQFLTKEDIINIKKQKLEKELEELEELEKLYLPS